MPSKAPSATALDPASGGKASSPRTICMQDADGFDLAPARHQLTDADHWTGDVVNSYEALGRRHGRDHIGRLPVGEDRCGSPVQSNDGPAGQCRLDGTHPGPELASADRRVRAPHGRFRAPHGRVRAPLRQLTPRHRVAQVEGADATSDEALDGSAEAERRPEVRGKDPQVRAFAADDAEGGPRSVDLLDQDRADDDLARRALDLDAGARELIEPSPLVVDR